MEEILHKNKDSFYYLKEYKDSAIRRFGFLITNSLLTNDKINTLLSVVNPPNW